MSTQSGTLPSRAPGVLARIGGALREPRFRVWFLGQLTSASGSMAQSVALSWVVLERTGNALWLSALTACFWGPTLLLGPWAGALVDRYDRRRLLLITQPLLMAIAATLSVLAATDRLTIVPILVLSALSGATTTVDAPARQVYVIDLVGEEAVASAVGLWEVALNAARVLGPGAAGALLATTGPAACFAVNGLAYCAPLLVLTRLAPSAVTPPRGAKRGGEVREGFGYVWRTPLLRTLMPMVAFSGLIFSMGIALPPLVERSLHLGGGGYGAMMAAFGLGGLPGALLAAGAPEPSARRVRLLALATGVSILCVAWAPAAPVAFVAMAATGLTSIWFIAAANTLVQLRSEPGLRGRVMALWGVAMTGTVPFTGLLVTALAQHVDARVAFSLSGAGLALATLAGWRALHD
ncbi:MFS transporter [Kitasatospora phosalacinea]|uniref:MFS transporter n=1 Tax=Kitasatospora phosalacinea TaxID=2065 RepID=A0ABW6GLF8_9ACTN